MERCFLPQSISQRRNHTPSADARPVKDGAATERSEAALTGCSKALPFPPRRWGLLVLLCALLLTGCATQLPCAPG